jgi:hypothetical protein
MERVLGEQMKNVLLLPLFCLVITTGCVSTRAGEESRFQRVKEREGNVDIGGGFLPATYTYRLTENDVLAFGPDTSAVTGPGWVLYIIDRVDNRVTFQSGTFETEGYGWWLNIYKTGPHVFILWENEGEYYTYLSLFVFNKKSRTCSYAGDFDVNQYFDGYYESSPYPIEGIHIEASDTLVSFKFTEKLWLRESDTSSRVADSLTYELDLHSDSLRVAKIWASDTLQ